MLNDELWVTDEQVLSPDSKSLYVYSHTEEETMQAAMQQVNIQGNRLVGYAEGKYIRTFSHYEYYLLKQKLAGKVDLIPLYHKDISKSHPFVIPEKGKPVKVYPWNVTLLCNTIVRHEGRVASVRGDTLYVGGKPVEAYTFNKNYYWMASNNPVNLCDSRLFGLVPDDHLIGKLGAFGFHPEKGAFFNECNNGEYDIFKFGLSGPVEYYTKLFACEKVYVEQYDNYVKQTYRNRCVIAAADGPLALTIPTEKAVRLNA